MILFKQTAAINTYLLQQQEQGHSIGFVPTMGALHPGHISLLHDSKTQNSISVCSIFVNPTQFNDSKDFDKYPSTIEKDIDALERAGCDLLFLPSVAEMYPNGTQQTGKYELGYLETVLEGKFRPGHFQGVCMVMDRLLSILPTNELYVGQKDYQQCMVIKKLIELKQFTCNINICPTLREIDGLAMSSRNMRLTEQDRKKAVKIFETLRFLKQHLKPGKLATIKLTAMQNLVDAGFTVDYIEIANAADLAILNDWNGTTKTVAVVAAFLGPVRLIDNMLLQDQ